MATSRIIDLNKADQKDLTLIKEIYQEYRKAKKDNNRKIEYTWRVLKPFFGHLRPDQITRETCMNYADIRQKSNGTIRRDLSVLRAALNWHDKNNSAVFWMPPKSQPKIDYLHQEQVDQLLFGCEEPHIKLFIVLSIATGARKSAVLQLTWDRVDFHRGLIDLGDDNGNKKRAVVPMNFTARQILTETYKSRLTDHVVEYRGKPIKDIKTGFKAALRRSPLSIDVNPNMLRHSAAVWMAEGKTPMSEISQYLGHTNTQVTESVYARYSPDYLQGAASHLELGSLAPRKVVGHA